MKTTRYVIDGVAYDCDVGRLNRALLEVRFELGGDWDRVAASADVSLTTLWRARRGMPLSLAALLRVIRVAGVPFTDVMRAVDDVDPTA